MSTAAITPESVLKLQAPTKGFLCQFTANTYGIDFLAFKIRNGETGEVIFDVAKDSDSSPVDFPPDFDFDQLRTIHYKFPVEFLSFKTVTTSLTFRVGPKEVHDFRMIERHYFRERLIKSYDFNFQFCIPNSTNEWEAVYDVPPLDKAVVAEMAAHPDETQSDSFYFVGNTLIMHNKAFYTYVPARELRQAAVASAASSMDAEMKEKEQAKESAQRQQSAAAGGSHNGARHARRDV